jgi:hypothetical protein
MKVGDLVKLKYTMWWKLRDRKDYTTEVAIVIERNHNALKLLRSNGNIKCDLAEHYEVVNESR